jgi:hypothetical protein
MPEGVSVPDNGTEFDLVCTFQPLGGNRVRLTRMGDTDMPEDKASKKLNATRPDYSRFANDMAGMMNNAPNEQQ